MSDIPPVPPAPAAPKSRLAYILLAVFLGTLGIHNFYAGYTKKAVIQLVLSLITMWVGLSVFVWIWAIVDACTVKQDAKGVPFMS